MIVEEKWTGLEYYWTDDLENVIEQYGLREFEHITPEQMNDGYYGTGRDLLDACRNYQISKPSDNFIGYFHHMREASIKVFQFNVEMDKDVWVKEATQFDMDFSLSGTDPSNPSWVKMCRLGEN